MDEAPDRTLEVRRQLVHLALGLGLMVMLRWVGMQQGQRILLAMLIQAVVSVAVVVGLLRLEHPTLQPHLERALARFGRPEERRVPALGVICFGLACWIVVRATPEAIALAAIAVLTLGDGVATLVGHSLGKRPLYWNAKKTLEGTLAGAIAAALGACYFVPPLSAMAAAAAAMLAESVPQPLDDNLVVPLVAALTLTLLA